MRRVLGDPAAVHRWLALTLAGLVAALVAGNAGWAMAGWALGRCWSRRSVSPAGWSIPACSGVGRVGLEPRPDGSVVHCSTRFNGGQSSYVAAGQTIRR
jgi:hypothetical protein